MTDYTTLPVYRSRQQILDALESSQVIIVESPTGSGKTTQIPLILHEAGYSKKGIIGITQPRRIAAMSVCEFIKNQIKDEESFCGYTMRFHDTTDSTTRIKILTDGILLQEVKTDPMLSKYSVIMVDEAHERSLNIDFILGLLKEIIPQRPELKVIISSATINAESFSAFFGNAPIVSIDGRMYPVQIEYKPLSWLYEDVTNRMICSLVYEAHLNPDGGDVLVFLPGEAEIKSCIQALKEDKFIDLAYYQIYPLYGRLSKEEQERVFTPTRKGCTKVVVSTNIAETSLTIDGIRTVIDAGEMKINYYNQKNFTSSLVTVPISKASANQRSGRAGRTQSGVCYRLYAKDVYDTKKEFTEEQILHSDLAEVVLRMSELGIYNPTTFPFITSPKKEALISAVNTLIYIGAIDGSNHLTNIGEMMIKFPLVPRLSRVIVEAVMKYPAVLNPVLTAVSFLSTKGPFVTPEDRVEEAREHHHMLVDNENGDFAAYLSIYRKYVSIPTDEEKKKFCDNNFLDKQTMDEIVHIKGQLRDIVSDMAIPVSENTKLNMEEYLICLASGLRQYICRKEADISYNYYTGEKIDRSSYTSIGADRIYIHPGSSWFKSKPKYILAGELVETSRLFARTVSPLEGDWINRIDSSLLSEIGKNKKERAKSYNSNTMREYEPEDTSDERFKNDIEDGIKDGDVIPLVEIGTIKERSDTEVFLSCGGYVSQAKYPLKYIDCDLSLIAKTDIPVEVDLNDRKYKITEESTVEEIKTVLSLLFKPYVVEDHLEFLGLTIDIDDTESRTDTYKLTSYFSVFLCCGTTRCFLDDASSLFKDSERSSILFDKSNEYWDFCTELLVDDYEMTMSSLCLEEPPLPPLPPPYKEEADAIKQAIERGEYKGRKVYPVWDFRRITERDDTEVYATIEGRISKVPVLTRLINKEFFFVIRDARLIEHDRFKYKGRHYTLKSLPYNTLKQKIENRILKIYAPMREDGFDGYFEYIYLASEGREFWFDHTPDITEAAKITYTALKKLNEEIQKSKKGYQTLKCYLEKQISEFEKRL